MNESPYGIFVEEYGGPDVLQVRSLELTPLAPGEVRLRQTAVGLNFIDIYHRSGLYPIALPGVIGSEAIGEVEAVGADVTDIRLGQTVGYCSAGVGAYASHRQVAADRVFPLPEGLPQPDIGGCLLKGLTVEYLIRRLYRVEPGQTVLFHAIAGGVGLIALQWLKQLGVTVIGTTSTAGKAEIARSYGCDYLIRYDQEDVVARVGDLTDGQGVPVVFDGVGAATFEASLDCLQPRGTMVSFGNASGAVPPVAPAVLASKGSLFLTRPTLGHYVARRDELRQAAADFFDAVAGGITLHCQHQYPLKNAAQAHRDLAGRKIIGQAVLIP